MKLNFATRQLIRSCSNGYLATEFDPKNFVKEKTKIKDIFPYSSFILTAFDYDLSPIIMVSDLSEHTKNLGYNNLASIMLYEEQKMYKFFPKFNLNDKKEFFYEDPMSRPRVTLIGKLRKTKSKVHKDRFLSRHLASNLYAGFEDMNFFVMDILAAHLVGGFAQVKWFSNNDLKCKDFENFEKYENQIIEHMNNCHSESLKEYVRAFIPEYFENDSNWKLIGIDPDGFDLRMGSKILRYSFDKQINDPKKLKETFVNLYKLANSN